MTDTIVTRSEPQKYQYVDVMRGIAILLIIFTHTGFPKSVAQGLKFFSFGQLGVQLFFVASALTLYLSMNSRGLSPQETVRFYI